MLKIIDKQSYRILELQSIVSMIIPQSEPGKKLKNELHPFKPSEVDSARKEYEFVAGLMTHLKDDLGKIEGVKLWLSHIKDLSGTLLGARNNVLELFELQEIKVFALAVRKIAELMSDCNFFPHSLQEMKELYYYLDPGTTETSSFQLYDEFSPELMLLRQALANLTREMKLKQQAKIREAMDLLKLTKCESEIIVSRTNTSMIKKLDDSGLFIRSKQNFANVMYKLKEDEADLNNAKKTAELITNIRAAEHDARVKITEHIRDHFLNSIVMAQDKIALFDIRFAKALFALRNKCSIPHINNHDKFILSDVVNLPIKRELVKSGLNYQPIDIELENSLSILIGANMAGKTSALKTIGQIAYLSAYAIPVPCSYAEIPLFDFIYFSGYDPQLQGDNLSSFAYNIVELQKHKSLEGKGLFLIDEFARGTNPQEGEALCRAVLESFSQTKHFVFTSTHFTAPAMIPNADHFVIPGLTEDLYKEIKSEKLLTISDRIAKLNSIQKYNLIKLDNEKRPPRTALMIADLLGVEQEVIDNAKSYLE